MDNTVHQKNHYPVNSVVCLVNINVIYPLDSRLSGGYHYSPFEQPGSHLISRQIARVEFRCSGNMSVKPPITLSLATYSTFVILSFACPGKVPSLGRLLNHELTYPVKLCIPAPTVDRNEPIRITHLVEGQAISATTITLSILRPNLQKISYHDRAN